MCEQAPQITVLRRWKKKDVQKGEKQKTGQNQDVIQISQGEIG